MLSLKVFKRILVKKQPPNKRKRRVQNMDLFEYMRTTQMETEAP